MAGRWETPKVDGSPMRCYITTPVGAGPFPAVIVIQHAGGVDPFVQLMTDRIAEAGFVGCAPDLYHRDDPNSSDDALTRMSHLRDKNIVADVDAAIDYMSKHAGVKVSGVGITGFCMGGRVAFLMATHTPAIKAAVVFYGGNILVSWGDGPTPFDRAGQIACPVLGLFGEDDGNPNPADVAKIETGLTQLGKTHEFHSYAGAGHAFMNEDRPSYRAETATDAWAKCVAWFQRHLA
jgi:carboxymethylenebutenolidase